MIGYLQTAWAAVWVFIEDHPYATATLVIVFAAFISDALDGFRDGRPDL